MEHAPQATESEPRSAGELKIQEYVNRIRGGESKEEIMNGLPPSFAAGIESVLAHDEATLQDFAQQEESREDATAELARLRADLGLEAATLDAEAVPVELLDQDAFADWLTEHLSAEDLRHVDVYTLLTVRPENRLMFISDAKKSSHEPGELYERRVAMLPELRSWAADAETLLARHTEGDIRGVSGTGWNHFVINESSSEGKVEDRKKGYVCLSGSRVLESFTVDVMEDILEKLRADGYHGQIKFPMTGGQLFDKFDNIVIHGDSDEETAHALELVEGILSEHEIGVQFTQSGADGVSQEGKKTSHSDLLAASVRERILSHSSR